MAKKEFDAVIQEGRGGAAWVAIPFDVSEAYGTRGQVKVVASFDGETYRGSIAPMGGGVHILGIPKAIREAIGKSIGDRVHVAVQRDTGEHTIAVPADFQKALNAKPAARKAFEKLSFTHRKEHVRAIEEAKKPETRQRRNHAGHRRAITITIIGISPVPNLSPRWPFISNRGK